MHEEHVKECNTVLGLRKYIWNFHIILWIYSSYFGNKIYEFYFKRLSSMLLRKNEFQYICAADHSYKSGIIMKLFENLQRRPTKMFINLTIQNFKHCVKNFSFFLIPMTWLEWINFSLLHHVFINIKTMLW